MQDTAELQATRASLALTPQLPGMLLLMLLFECMHAGSLIHTCVPSGAPPTAGTGRQTGRSPSSRTRGHWGRTAARRAAQTQGVQCRSQQGRCRMRLGWRLAAARPAGSGRGSPACVHTVFWGGGSAFVRLLLSRVKGKRCSVRGIGVPVRQAVGCVKAPLPPCTCSLLTSGVRRCA
jgi:hypothetical protein